MKNFIAILFVLLIFLPVTAFARIGETLAQCETRYGKVRGTDPNSGIVAFLKSGFGIAISFHQGKADGVYYRNKDNTKELSDSEIETFLKANGRAKQWKKIDGFFWLTEDGTLSALYDPIDKFLFVCTTERMLREAARKKAKEKKQLDGF